MALTSPERRPHDGALAASRLFRRDGLYRTSTPDRGVVRGAIIHAMNAQTIDQEFEKLQAEFQDVAKAVRELATKLQSAQKAGDANAGEWLGDLETIAKEVDDEQTQSKVILLALHSFITEAAQASSAAEKPELFAPGQDPFPEGQSAPQQQGPQRRHGLFGGMMGGGGGGYMGGGFGQAMEMGMGMQLGADLIGSIFR